MLWLLEPREPSGDHPQGPTDDELSALGVNIVWGGDFNAAIVSAPDGAYDRLSQLAQQHRFRLSHPADGEWLTNGSPVYIAGGRVVPDAEAVTTALGLRDYAGDGADADDILAFTEHVYT